MNDLTETKLLSRRGFFQRLLKMGLFFSGAWKGRSSGKLLRMHGNKQIPICGIYFHDGFELEPREYAPLHWGLEEWKREIRWLYACGVNTIEFATMLEFTRIPSTPYEQQKISSRQKILEFAHQLGMKFGYILTTTVVSAVPENEEPGDQLRDRAIVLCPQETENYENTIAIQKWYMRAFSDADFFEVFAGDWGGCTCGICGVRDYLRYVTDLAREASSIRNDLPVFANTWAISYWSKDPLKDGWAGFFDRELELSREVIRLLPTLQRNVHLALPCHHLYRALAFSSYGSKQATPKFPTEADVQLVSAASRELLAWPHFVMDDDAYRPAAWGIVHSEVRYIRTLLQTLQSLGVHHVMGNLYNPWMQLINTYAFGSFVRDSRVSAEEVLSEFARILVKKEDKDPFTEVLFWLDNHSYWQEQLPSDAREPLFDVSLTKDQVLQILRKIKVKRTPELPLPIEADKWLNILSYSIERMNWV